MIARIRAALDREPSWPFWLHLDVDVLDQSLMPAVDSPGSPGIDPDMLIAVCRSLFACGRCCGVTVTVFDPDLDPDGVCARRIVTILADAFDCVGE